MKKRNLLLAVIVACGWGKDPEPPPLPEMRVGTYGPIDMNYAGPRKWEHFNKKS